MNDYEVFWVEQHDPYKLTLLGYERADNGHMAIQKRIAWEAEDGRALKAGDLVAYATWAAQREHHPGPVAAATTRDLSPQGQKQEDR